MRTTHETNRKSRKTREKKRPTLKEKGENPNTKNRPETEKRKKNYDKRLETEKASGSLKANVRTWANVDPSKKKLSLEKPIDICTF